MGWSVAAALLTVPGDRGESERGHRAVSHSTRLLSSLVPRPISSVFQGKSREWLKTYHRRLVLWYTVDGMLTRIVALYMDQV